MRGGASLGHDGTGNGVMPGVLLNDSIDIDAVLTTQKRICFFTACMGLRDRMYGGLPDEYQLFIHKVVLLAIFNQNGDLPFRARLSCEVGWSYSTRYEASGQTRFLRNSSVQATYSYHGHKSDHNQGLFHL